jgi:diguanylate cyclase (GGDEF)-like protein
MRRFYSVVLPKSIHVALALLALAAGALRAQQYSFRTFGISDGLGNLVIHRIYQDRAGFLWVSTENGIYRYDGDRFEPFGKEQGIPSNSGAGFGEAPDGSLLTGGAFGLFHLEGNRFVEINGEFKTIAWAQGIESDGKGHTWLGTDAGLVELSSTPGKAEFAQRTLPKPKGASYASAYGILIDGDVVWYGCGLELCRMDAKGTQVYARDFKLPAMPITAIRKDRSGGLWVRERNDGVMVWPAGKAGFERPKLPFPPEDLGGLPTMDSNGRILLPSPEGLLIGEGKEWQRVDRSVGLRGVVYAAFEDRQHSLWIGMAGRGLVQWRGYREWESYTSESGLAGEVVYEILPEGNGSVLVATEAGVFRGERGKFTTTFKAIPGLYGFPVHSIQRSPAGDLWIGTETRGAARYDTRTRRIEWFGEAEGLGPRQVYALRFDREQRLWAATDEGLYRSNPPYRRFSRIADLPPIRIWAIAEGTDGTLWAGGNGGLYELAGGQWKNLTRADGLSNLEVLSLGAGKDGVVWVGYRYGGGIDRVHPRDGGVTIEKGVQRAGSDGLVYFLDLDAAGRLWAGTEHGVDVWDGTRWNHYDTSDGLAWDDCDLNAFAEEPDGTVWIGTGAGLSRFKPHPHQAQETPLEVVFTRLAMGQTDVSGLHNPAFGIHSNSFFARYSVLNAPRQNAVVFRYRLGGAASGWTETSERELRFANLAPGNYFLAVEARDSDGMWSAHAAQFPFRVLTPWYSTLWFAGLCLLIPSSVVGATLRLRFLGAQRRERELVKLVEEKTADLRRANEELQRLSFTDPLTGLANRRVYTRILDRECPRMRRTGSALSLLSIDVDQFKALNDSQGHQRGDECLVLLSAELDRLCRRKIDVAARCGGEEFAIVLLESDAAWAEQTAENVRAAIEALRLPHPTSPVSPFLTVSVGVATAARDWCFTPETLAAAADRALYAAKRSGRNRVCVAERGPDGEEIVRPATAVPA